RRGGRELHHIVDPSTGEPAPEHWRTVSVAAATCLGANTASTAVILRGPDSPVWLAARNLPAWLVAADGAAVHVAAPPPEPQPAGAWPFAIWHRLGMGRDAAAWWLRSVTILS